MAGILTQSSSGFICAETFDSYPNGGAFAQSGTATASASSTTPSHAGAAAFRIATGKTWPANAYGKLTKTLNLLTGANRVLRAFRGPLTTSDWLTVIYDDFSGSTIDTSLWSVSPTVTESGGEAHLSPGALWSLLLTLTRSMRVGARFAATSGANGTEWHALHYGEYQDTEIFLDFTSGVLTIIFMNAGSYDTVTFSVQDTSMHLWEVDWEAAYVDIYKDGVLFYHYTGSNIPSQTPTTYPFVYWTDFSGIVDIDYVATADHAPNAAVVANAYKHSLIIGSQTFYDIRREQRPWHSRQRLP